MDLREALYALETATRNIIGEPFFDGLIAQAAFRAGKALCAYEAGEHRTHPCCRSSHISPLRIKLAASVQRSHERPAKSPEIRQGRCPNLNPESVANFCYG